MMYAGNDIFEGEADNRDHDGPIMSMRLKNMRRGVQDIEYVWLAEQNGLMDTTWYDDIYGGAGHNFAAFDDFRYPADHLYNQYPGYSELGYEWEAIRREMANILGGVEAQPTLPSRGAKRIRRH